MIAGIGGAQLDVVDGCPALDRAKVGLDLRLARGQQIIGTWDIRVIGYRYLLEMGPISFPLDMAYTTWINRIDFGYLRLIFVF